MHSIYLSIEQNSLFQCRVAKHNENKNHKCYCIVLLKSSKSAKIRNR